jgi:hypothetical protein
VYRADRISTRCSNHDVAHRNPEGAD